MEKEKIKELAKSVGWTVLYDNDENSVEFATTSLFGCDYRFSVELNENIVESVHERFSSFDTSTEAYKWLDSNGHGANGAPYDMKDLYEDMETIAEKLDELWQALENLN